MKLFFSSAPLFLESNFTEHGGFYKYMFCNIAQKPANISVWMKITSDLPEARLPHSRPAEADRPVWVCALLGQEHVVDLKGSKWYGIQRNTKRWFITLRLPDYQAQSRFLLEPNLQNDNKGPLSRKALGHSNSSLAQPWSLFHRTKQGNIYKSPE